MSKAFYIGGGALVLVLGYVFYKHQQAAAAAAATAADAATNASMLQLALGAGGGLANGSTSAASSTFYPQAPAATVSPAAPSLDLVTLAKQSNDFNLQQNMQNNGLQAFTALINAVPSNNTAGGVASAKVNTTVTQGDQPQLQINGTVDKVLPASTYAPAITLH